MIKLYFSSIISNLWRNRLFTVLNVFGLAVAICASWMIFRLVAMEYNYDKEVPEKDRVYQLVVQTEAGGETNGFAGVARALLPELTSSITGIELIVPAYFQYIDNSTVMDSKGVKKDIEPSFRQIATSGDYFKLLDYSWLAGDKRSALNDINSIVLTEKRARLYFPGSKPEEIVGKTITLNDTTLRIVTGVVAALPYLNSFDTDEFIPVGQKELSNDVWSGYSSSDQLYVRLSEGVKPIQVVSQINVINEARNKDEFVKYGFKNWYHMLPLAEKHFATEYNANTRVANKNVLNGLMLIAGFILLLGCINYINLSTALLPQRSKELGIRKTLGSTARQLISGFAFETAVIAMIAMLLSFLFSHFVGGVLKDFLPDSYSDYINMPLFLIFLISLLIVITLVAGYYPALVMTKIDTVKVLKGQLVQTTAGKKRLRKGLIVFQFVIAQFFIICAIIIGQQLHYAMSKDFGFKKEAVVTIEIPYKAREGAFKESHFVLKNALLATSGIEGVSIGNLPMTNSMMSNTLKLVGDTANASLVRVHIKNGDSNYVSLYNIQLLAGRNIRTSDSSNGYLINEKALSAFGLKDAEEAVGKFLTYPDGKERFQIVGVVKDFHQFGMQSNIEALAIRPPQGFVGSMSVKLSAGSANWSQTLKKIENKWNELYPGFEFKYKFYDEVIAALYKQEQQTASLVRLATYISIFISCLGLFGLATLTAFQRTKEIGIRKVLGASLTGVVGLLSKEYIKLIVISIIVAAPLAWWTMNKWLEDFAFRINIEWWMFLIAGGILLIIAFLTVSYQSVKAAIANPVKSLRTE